MNQTTTQHTDINAAVKQALEKEWRDGELRFPISRTMWQVAQHRGGKRAATLHYGVGNRTYLRYARGDIAP